MKKILTFLRSEESGQGMVEYALIIALIAVVLIGVISALGTKIGDVFTSVDNALDTALAGGASPDPDPAPTPDPDPDVPCSHVDTTPKNHICDLCSDNTVVIGGTHSVTANDTNGDHECDYCGVGFDDAHVDLKRGNYQEWDGSDGKCDTQTCSYHNFIDEKYWSGSTQYNGRGDGVCDVCGGDSHGWKK